MMGRSSSPARVETATAAGARDRTASDLDDPTSGRTAVAAADSRPAQAGRDTPNAPDIPPAPSSSHAATSVGADEPALQPLDEPRWPASLPPPASHQSPSAALPGSRRSAAGPDRHRGIRSAWHVWVPAREEATGWVLDGLVDDQRRGHLPTESTPVQDPVFAERADTSMGDIEGGLHRAPCWVAGA